jgi:hypothetical protein
MQHGGPLPQIGLSYRTAARLAKWILGIDSWAPWTFTNSGPVYWLLITSHLNTEHWYRFNERVLVQEMTDSYNTIINTPLSWPLFRGPFTYKVNMFILSLKISAFIRHIARGVLEKVDSRNLKTVSSSIWPMTNYQLLMDERTKKTPNPKCRLYWCFCLGWCSNFVGSDSGQKQSVQLLQNMVYNTTQHPPTPPHRQPHTVCVYCTFTLGRGGRSERR